MPHRICDAASFPDLIPAKPFCADYYEEGIVIRTRRTALKRRHIQVNGPKSFDFLVFDIDRDNAYRAAEDANLPPPNIIAINPGNGHGHLMYVLDKPVLRFDSARREPIEFFSDVQRGIIRRLGGDRNFNGVVVKNPLHQDWRSSFEITTPYSLAELDRHLERSDKARMKAPQEVFGEGRNCTVFEDLRQLAYHEAISCGFATGHGFLDHLIELASGINLQFNKPLSPNEVRSIAKSVAKFVSRKFSSERFSEIQSHRGKLSAAKRWEGHTADSTLKPWVTMGISRSVYYNRKAAGTL